MASDCNSESVDLMSYGDLTNIAADKHFWMRLRRNGGSVLAAELKALASR
jgi:hypothetical protein